MFYYHAFGLNFASQIEIPQFVQQQKTTVDVAIKQQPVADSLEQTYFAKGRFQASPGNLLLKIKDVARYHIKNGNEIIIDRQTNDLSCVRIYLLGSCITALLYQRNSFVLHASSILTDKGAIVFSGPKKVGKSTLAASFAILKQYPVIADDVVRISNLRVFPSFSSVNLWQDAVDKLSLPQNELTQVRPNSSSKKFSYNLTNCFHEPVPLRKIYILKKHSEANCSIRDVNITDKIHFLLNNSYRKNFIMGLGQSQQHLQRVSNIAHHIPMSLVTRSSNAWEMDRLLQKIEQNFGELA